MPHVTQNDRQVFTLKDSNLVLHHPISIETISCSSLTTSVVTTNDFQQQVKMALPDLDLFQRFQKGQLSSDYTSHDDLLWYKGLLVIPTHDLQLKVLKRRHDSPTSGHPGTIKTMELISRDFFWPGIRRMIKKYVAG